MRNYLGNNLQFTYSEADLEAVQFMLDDEAYDADGSNELYDFGVVLGNVFHAQSTMKWTVVTNEFGRRVAVHDPAIGFTNYPVQMIAKRVNDRRAVKVLELYQGFIRDLGIGSSHC